VYITPTVSLGGYGIDKKTNGLISISGPLTNIAAALIFFFTAQLGKLSGNFLASQIGLLGLQINLWLAAFNLLPFGPLDGQKIFAWNIAIWAGIAIPLWAINILLFIGII
jgi:Zn-dependent protease